MEIVTDVEDYNKELIVNIFVNFITMVILMIVNEFVATDVASLVHIQIFKNLSEYLLRVISIK